jgi:hypothetical protein
MDILAQLNSRAPTSVQSAISVAKVDVVEADLLHTDVVPFIHGGVDDTPLKFGKYRGTKTPRDLIDFDPQYLLWCDANLEYQNTSPELMAYVKHRERGDLMPVKLGDIPPMTMIDMDDDIPF